MGGTSVGVAVMQTRQDGHRNHLTLNAIGGRGSALDKPGGNPLLNALVRAMLIVVGHIFLNDALQLSLTEYEEIIKSFSFQTAEKSLANGICSWCFERSE
jgi:hypothetical protein